MSNIHEVIARLKADGAGEFTSSVETASDAVETFGDTTEETVERSESAWGRLEDNVNAISGVLAGVGAASEGFARSQQPANEALARTAIATGESTDALRASASGMSDYTFATEDAIAGMERLVQSGYDTVEQFEAILPAVDTLADATGMELTDALDSAERALRPLGLGLEDVADNGDQLTRMINQANIPLSTLERNLGRVPDELQALEFGLDDAAAGIEVFRDRGYSGEEAVREFRRAVAASEGDMGSFLDTLGLSADEWEHYQQAVEPTPGLMQTTADEVNGLATPLQRLQANLANTMTRFGGFADAAGMLAPVTMGLASGLQVLTRAKGAAAVATRGLSAALAFLSANPIGLVIVGIGLLVAAGIWLWRNWDQVTEWISGAWQWLSDRITGIVDWLREGPLGGLITGMEMVWDAWSAIFDWISDKVSAVFGEGGFVGVIRGAINSVIGLINGAINGINSISVTIPDFPGIPGRGQTIGFSIPNIPTLNAGGLVPGGGPNADTVLAALTPGEWVLNRDAASTLGPDTLAALNRLDASSTTGAVGSPSVSVVVRVEGDVLDPEDWFRRNRKAMADSVGRALAETRAGR